MRIVATTTDRTFYLNHADLCAAWGQSSDGYLKAVTDDLVYAYTKRLPCKAELVVRDGVTYIEEVEQSIYVRRDNVRAAVTQYLRNKFRVRSAISFKLDGCELIATVGLY